MPDFLAGASSQPCLGGVDVWLAFEDDARDPSLLARYVDVMTQEERDAADRFHFPKDRHRYLVTRALVRGVLSSYEPAIAPEKWRFETGPNGRPRLAGDMRLSRPLEFNVSHSSGLVALAVTAGHAVGIDVEGGKVSEATLAIAHRYFASSEVKALRELPLHAQPRRFLECWTLKEAYVKARGAGLSIPLDQFSFSFPDDFGIRMHIGPELNDSASRWRLWQFRPAAHCMAALCVARVSEPEQMPRMWRAVPLSRAEPFACALLRDSGNA